MKFKKTEKSSYESKKVEKELNLIASKVKSKIFQREVKYEEGVKKYHMAYDSWYGNIYNEYFELIMSLNSFELFQEIHNLFQGNGYQFVMQKVIDDNCCILMFRQHGEKISLTILAFRNELEMIDSKPYIESLFYKDVESNLFFILGSFSFGLSYFIRWKKGRILSFSDLVRMKLR